MKYAINNCRTRAAKATAPEEDTETNRRGHVEELLNRPPSQNPPDIAPAEEVLQINCERPSKADIEKAIHHMKKGKLPTQTKFLPRQSRLK